MIPATPSQTTMPSAHRVGLRGVLLAALLVLLPTSWVAAQMPPIIVITPPALAAREGMVWGGLVYASEIAPSEKHAPPGDFPDLPRRLARVFPRYKNFDVIGRHSQVIYRQYESWVVPSKDFFLKIDSKGIAPRGGLFVHLQFWESQQVLVKMDAILRPNSPLFIAGPKWRHGRLIFVVELRRLEPRMGATLRFP